MLDNIKKLYNWTLSLSSYKYVTIYLFLIAIAESSFFPIPPDILLVALCLSNRRRSFVYASITLLGSILGGVIGYYIGHQLWWDSHQYSSLANFFFNNIPGFNQDIFENIKQKFSDHGFFIIFTAGFTPIPYKIFTIASGAFNISFNLFILGSIVSRMLRFFLISILIYKWGETIKNFIDKYFNLLTIIFTIFLICGYIIISLLR